MKKEAPLLRLLKYARIHRGQFVRGTIYSFLNKAFDVAPEILIGVAVDLVVKRENSYVARFIGPDVKNQLYFLAVLTFFIWVFESLFEYLYNLEWRNLAQTIQHEMRLDAYRHAQRLDLAFFEGNSSGNITSILNDDINQLERFLDGGANPLIQVFAAVILVGTVFFVLSPTLGFFSLIPIPIILFGAFRFQKLADPLYRGVRAQAGRLASRLTSNMMGIATIKSQTAEVAEARYIEKLSQEYRLANAKAIRLSSAFVPLIRMAILFGFIVTLLVGGSKALAGEIEIGVYSVLIFLTQRLLWPLTTLAQTVDLFQRAMASTQRVLDLLETPIQNDHGDIVVRRAETRGELKFQNVVFGYAGRDKMFKGLELFLPAGQTTAIVGYTGAGKSTIAKLLLRFYAPDAGQIFLDGVDLQKIEVRSLRNQIGFVNQDVFLFDGTVEENITLGDEEIAHDTVVKAAKAAEAHEFVMSLPDGYQTLVGERGIRLSGGQRQRLAIARALLRDPPILILDEATSAVDNETERLIQRSLEKIAVGRTVLIIAHRLSTIRHADRIYVLNQGKVATVGTHDGLLADSPLYAHLWKVQTGDRVV